MFDIERQFLGAKCRQRAFQRRDIQRGLAAKTLIEHPGIGPRLLDDAADAPPGEARGREPHRGGTQYLLAVLLRGAAGTAARRSSRPMASPVDASAASSR